MGKHQSSLGALFTGGETCQCKGTLVLAALAGVALFAIATIAGTAFAQRAAVPHPQDTVALGEVQVKQLLLLMDTNKNGKISKQEWMKFMAEFDRLDKNKTEELDVEELTQSKVEATPFAKTGK